MVLLLCFFVNVVSADVKIDSSVMDMPDRCESCRVSVGDFQKESNKIPLKVEGGGVGEGTFLDLFENFCNSMYQYKVHVGVKGIERFQKEDSGIVKNLKKFHKQGTKVKTDVPIELWDTPSIETERLRFDCEAFFEEFEDDMLTWFLKHRKSKDLVEQICYDSEYGPCHKQKHTDL